MKNFFFYILILISHKSYSQAANIKVPIKTSSLPSFSIDTLNVNDIIVVNIELKGNDTIKQEVEVKYKIDKKGRIITSCRTENNKNSFWFYTYEKYPEIYLFINGERNLFQIFKCNKRGQLIEFSDFSKLEKEKDVYWKGYISTYSYDSISGKVQMRIINDVIRTNHKSEYFYDEKSRLKKSAFSHPYYLNRETPLEINYSINDSSYTQYSKVANDSTIITYTHIIFYDSDYKIISEKESELVSQKNGRKYYMVNIEKHYLFDDLSRLIEIKTVSVPEKGKPVYQWIKQYRYNTNKLTNIKQLDVEKVVDL